MPLARSRRAQRPIDYWPGFVDALTTMLLVITFLLSVFMLAQFFLAREVSGKDTVLTKLNKQIAELTAQLALSQMNKSDAESQISVLNATLDSERKKSAALQGEIAAASAGNGSADARVTAAEQALKDEKDVSAQALAQVEILNQQIGALRRQLAAIEDALAASESRDKQSQAKIADLGSRLNIALAQKVQELARYRSDFFGRLRQILGDRPDIRTVGDRFVFQSEVLFDSGKAELKSRRQDRSRQTCRRCRGVEQGNPAGNSVDSARRRAHRQTADPIVRIHSNWDLSASRAIAVVEYLVSKGVPADRLVAAGFGEFQPIDPGEGDDAYAKNRRIELKLTEKIEIGPRGVSETQMAEWADFFVAEIGASAALTGLIAVAISINLSRILAFKTLPGLAASALILLGSVLVLTSAALIPHQPMGVFGFETLAVALVMLIVPAILQIRPLKAEPMPKGRAIIRVIINGPPGLAILIAGILLVLGHPAWTLLVRRGRHFQSRFGRLDRLGAVD